MKVQRQAVLHLAVAMATLVLNSICAHADTVYVWSNDGTIQRFNTNGVGTLLTNNLSNWNGPVGLACDNVGNLYAGYPGWSIIWRFSPDGTSRMVGEPDSVSGLAFDSTGSLYVTIPNYTEICRLTYYLGQAYFLFTPPGTNYTQSHLSYPLNLAFDSTGSIYVLNQRQSFPCWWPKLD